MNQDGNDLTTRCQECAGFLDRVPLRDECGAGQGEIALAKKTLLEASHDIRRLNGLLNTLVNTPERERDSPTFHALLQPYRTLR